MPTPRVIDEVQVRPALARFRVASIVEGVALLVLVAIMVMRYLVHPEPGNDHDFWTMVSGRWSPVHGLIYMIYVILSFDLWIKMRWRLPRMLLLMLFGVIPVLSFFGERWVHGQVERELARRPTYQDAEGPGTGAPPTLPTR